MNVFQDKINKEGKEWNLINVNKFGIATYETKVKDGARIRKSWCKFDLGLIPKREEQPQYDFERRMSGAKEPQKTKYVYRQYDMRKRLIKEYDSIAEASEITGIEIKRISYAHKKGTELENCYWERALRNDKML